MNKSKNGFENNSIANFLFPDNSFTDSKHKTPHKTIHRDDNQRKDSSKSFIPYHQNKQTLIQKKRSYSPVSNNIEFNPSYYHQQPKHKPQIELPKSKVKTPIELPKPFIQKKPIPIIEKKRPIPKEEAKLIDKLKNFNCIDDLYENIEKYGDKYDKLLSNNKKKQVKPKEVSKVYRPKSELEIKKLEQIDRINQTLNYPSQLLSNKRYRSNNKLSKQELTYDSKERFCNECHCMHLPNCHIRKRAINIDYNKIFPAPTQKKQEETKGVHSNQKLLNEKLNKLKEEIKKNNKSNKANQLNNNHQKTSVKKLFTKDDFEDNVSFSEDEDDTLKFKKYMAKINNKLRKRKGNLYRKYENDDSDDDLMEADFETIQREEMRSAAIGRYEDEMAEI